jgi:RNA polymerase sigma-70 factor (TIGR02943 family)
MSANETISQWVNEYADEMFRYTYSKVSKQEVAEDIVQNTFLAACQSFSNFRKESSAKTWLFSILKNKIIDYYRSAYKRTETLNYQDKENAFEAYFFSEDDHWKNENEPRVWNSDEHLLDNADFNFTLNNCIEKLPSKWSLAIQLKYIDDKDSSDICKDLEITSSNYWQILHRAKLQLRECLEKNWFKK